MLKRISYLSALVVAAVFNLLPFAALTPPAQAADTYRWIDPMTINVNGTDYGAPFSEVFTLPNPGEQGVVFSFTTFYRQPNGSFCPLDGKDTDVIEVDRALGTVSTTKRGTYHDSGLTPPVGSQNKFNCVLTKTTEIPPGSVANANAASAQGTWVDSGHVYIYYLFTPSNFKVPFKNITTVDLSDRFVAGNVTLTKLANPNIPNNAKGYSFFQDNSGSDATCYDPGGQQDFPYKGFHQPYSIPTTLAINATSAPREGIMLLATPSSTGDIGTAANLGTVCKLKYDAFDGVFSTHFGDSTNQAHPFGSIFGPILHEECNKDNPTATGCDDPSKEALFAGQTTGGGGGGGSNQDTCDAGGFSWILCPVIDGLKVTISKIEDIIGNLLFVTPLSNRATDPVFVLWTTFKGLANAFFIVVFMVIIFANTLSLGLDAYTIKKTLPRLVVAAIAVQFSYLFSSLLIDAFNVFGHGVLTLVDHVLTGSGLPLISTGGGHSDVVLGMGTIIGGVTVGILTGLGFLTVFWMLTLLGAFFAIISVVATLIFRQVIIVGLVIAAPLAFLAWVLPNTQNFFKLWTKNLLRALAMYPIIIGLFAAGKIFATVASASPVNAVLKAIFALGALIIPLFMVPMTFKWGGQAFAGAAKLIDKARSSAKKGVTDSGLVKNMLEDRKYKASLKSGEEGVGRIARFRAGVRAGHVPWSSGSRRKLGAAFEKANKQAKEDYGGQLARAKLDRSDDDLLGLIKTKDGKKYKGIKADNQSKAKALELMATQAMWKNLGAARDELGDSHPAWNDMMRTKFPDVYKKRRSLALGPPKEDPERPGVWKTPYDGIKTEEMADIHPTEIPAMLESARISPTARRDIAQAIEGVADRAPLSGRFDKKITKAIRASASEFEGVELPGRHIPASRFLSENIDENGNFVNLRPEGGGGGRRRGGGAPAAGGARIAGEPVEDPYGGGLGRGVSIHPVTGEITYGPGNQTAQARAAETSTATAEPPAAGVENPETVIPPTEVVPQATTEVEDYSEPASAPAPGTTFAPQAQAAPKGDAMSQMIAGDHSTSTTEQVANWSPDRISTMSISELNTVNPQALIRAWRSGRLTSEQKTALEQKASTNIGSPLHTLVRAMRRSDDTRGIDEPGGAT